MDEWKYSYCGAYRYAQTQPHTNQFAWCYHQPKNWSLRLKGDKADRKFSEIADGIKGHLPDLKAKLSNLAGFHEILAQSPMIDWHATGNAKVTSSPPVVDPALAIMLNHTVSFGTIEPFRILTTFVEGHVIVHVQKSRPGVSTWFYLKLPDKCPWLELYLLMQPDWFFKVPPKGSRNTNLRPFSIQDDSELKSALERTKAIRVLHEYSVVSYKHTCSGAGKSADTIDIELKDSVTMVPYPKGLECRSIPLPGKQCRFGKDAKEPHAVLTPEVVISSPCVQECIVNLDRIWQDRSAKSVLISAPPGSGKEVYASSIPYASGRVTGDLAAISLADDPVSLQKQLFGQVRADGSIQCGLLSRASKTALFLDEVHQPVNSLGIRPALLRPLESDEYYPTGSSEPEKVDDVLFILATSLPLNELESVKPVDFWTRMTHVLPIKHPLDFDDESSQTKDAVLKDFFKCFWWDRVEKLFNMNPALLRKDLEHAGPWLKEQHVANLIERDSLETVAGNFSENITTALQEMGISHKDVSIRGVRSMISRLVSIAANEISRGGGTWTDTVNDGMSTVINEILSISNLAKKSDSSKIKS